MASDRIVIRGAREHNLKNIDLEIPRDQLVVITGLSGSGKSSLAFDTIYAEGQRRYVESLSAYARQFLEQMEKPEVDSIEGLSPAISIEQKTTSRNPRSTVGTVTEIYDYLRVLFARIGIPHCPSCGRVISAQTVQQMVDRVLGHPPGTRLLVLAPVIRGRKGEYKKMFFDLRRQGYSRVRVNGVLRELSDEIDLDKNRKHTIEVLVDRLVVRENVGSRLADSLETALRLADGVVQVEPVGDADRGSATAQTGGAGGSGTVPPVKQSRPSVKSPTSENAEPMLFSERLACAECGVSLPEVSPRMFSFNSPYGACETCSGLGSRWEVDPERVVPNAERTLKQGALAPWAGHESPYFKQTLAVLAKRYKFTLDTPWKSLKKSVRDVILHGDADGGFEGVVAVLERRYRETESEDIPREIEPFMAERPCPACKGSRLRPESLGLKIGGRSIAEVVGFTIKEAAAFFADVTLSERETLIARRVLKEIRERLGFLRDVGLDYLTADRPLSVGRAVHPGPGRATQGPRPRADDPQPARAQSEGHAGEDPAGNVHVRDRRVGLGQVDAGERHPVSRPRPDAASRAGAPGSPRTDRRRAASRQGHRHRPVADRTDTPVESGDLHGRLHVHPHAVRAHAGGPDARLPARPLLLQRQGRPLRGLPGRRAREDRDALPARRLRDVRRLQGQALQPRDAGRPVQGQVHRRGPRHDRTGGARVLRRGARDQIEAPDARRRWPRLHPARASGHHVVGR